MSERYPSPSERDPASHDGDPLLTERYPRLAERYPALTERYPAAANGGSRASRRGPSSAGGQSLVEFAFVLPIIVLLVSAFIDIGRAVFQMNALTNAAREASRVAAVNQLDPVDGPWQCFANKPVEDPANPGWTFRGCAITAGNVLGVKHSDVSISYSAPPGTTLSCSTPAVGCLATVTVIGQFIPITPVAGSLIGSIALDATSTMPIERLFP